MLKKAIAWMFVTNAMRDARRRLRDTEEARGQALQQARLLAEIAARVAEPAEPLPAGDRAPVILGLVREAVTLVLTSTKASANLERTALATAWAEAPEDILRDAAQELPSVEAIKDILLPVAPADAKIATTADDLGRARAFLERLLWNADAPRRRVETLLIQRWLRVAGVVVVLVLAGTGLRVVTRGKNLIAGKPFTVSSSWTGCPTDPMCDGLLLFHTNSEFEPSVTYDLMAPTRVHQVEVTNRPDCCGDRAIPLVVEVSLDRKQWTEVARKTDEFSTWSASFPSRTARYVRLKVGRVSVLHLKNVEVR